MLAVLSAVEEKEDKTEKKACNVPINRQTIASVSGMTISQLLFKCFEWKMGTNGFDVPQTKMRSVITSVVDQAI